MALRGHFWTFWPTVADRISPLECPGTPVATEVQDRERGALTLRGRLIDTGSDTCLVLVHGLGGDHDAPYCKRAARAAASLGISSLRMSLRGADLSGQDFYHAGLVADLSAVLASDAAKRFGTLLVLGFSLGGHITLRYALAPDDPRVRAVAAVCPPLDLARSAETLHRLRSRVYERAILGSLIDLYAQVEAKGTVPTPLSQVRRVGSIRQWDALTVAPRFGFDGVEDYYARMSVGPRLEDLAVRSLVVHSHGDPMIPAETYAGFRDRFNAENTTWVEVGAGGHVGFPEGVDLGLGFAATTVEDQVVRHLLAQAALAGEPQQA